MSRLEMPDLQYLGGLQTNGRSFERGVYFEQLRSIAGKLDILSRGAGAGASISFPKMEDAGEVSVDAGGAVINLESLQTVQGDLNLTDVAAAPLPALQSAGYIRIDGRLSYISLPDLKTAGAGRRPPTTTTTGARDDLSTGSGIYIDQYLSGIALEIPRLTYVEGDVEIRGAIIDLALPSLESVTGALYLSVRTSVGLPALRSAAEIGLFEVRGDASIPHLNPTNTTLLISSLPCSSFGAGLRDSPEYAERCAQYEEEKLSTGAKAAVGVVVPLVVLGIFLAILACHKRRVRRGEKAVGMVVGDVEMVDLPSTRGSGRDDGGDGDGDIERGRIPVTQPGRMESERSPTPPPPYEPRRE
ncbi:hypothetical protein BJX66DRAFT_266847 [Aspergillus keveii]|uniref:Uncharacterized protein n=1 Tax=Aspergillus keveii TaxID=714993 RepID=A0ABR4FXK8_9EURO